METEIITCNKCGKDFDYGKSYKCTHCGEYQNVEDEDFCNGIAYPAHEIWED